MKQPTSGILVLNAGVKDVHMLENSADDAKANNVFDAAKFSALKCCVASCHKSICKYLNKTFAGPMQVLSISHLSASFLQTYLALS